MLSMLMMILNMLWLLQIVSKVCVCVACSSLLMLLMLLMLWLFEIQIEIWQKWRKICVCGRCGCRGLLAIVHDWRAVTVTKVNYCKGKVNIYMHW